MSTASDLFISALKPTIDELMDKLALGMAEELGVADSKIKKVMKSVLEDTKISSSSKSTSKKSKPSTPKKKAVKTISLDGIYITTQYGTRPSTSKSNAIFGPDIQTVKEKALKNITGVKKVPANNSLGEGFFFPKDSLKEVKKALQAKKYSFEVVDYTEFKKKMEKKKSSKSDIEDSDEEKPKNKKKSSKSDVEDSDEEKPKNKKKSSKSDVEDSDEEKPKNNKKSSKKSDVEDSEEEKPKKKRTPKKKTSSKKSDVEDSDEEKPKKKKTTPKKKTSKKSDVEESDEEKPKKKKSTPKKSDVENSDSEGEKAPFKENNNGNFVNQDGYVAIEIPCNKENAEIARIIVGKQDVDSDEVGLDSVVKLSETERVKLCKDEGIRAFDVEMLEHIKSNIKNGNFDKDKKAEFTEILEKLENMYNEEKPSKSSKKKKDDSEPEEEEEEDKDDEKDE